MSLNVRSVSLNGNLVTLNVHSVTQNGNLIRIKETINLIKRQTNGKVQTTRNVEPQWCRREASVPEVGDQQPVGHKGVCRETAFL